MLAGSVRRDLALVPGSQPIGVDAPSGAAAELGEQVSQGLDHAVDVSWLTSGSPAPRTVASGVAGAVDGSADLGRREARVVAKSTSEMGLIREAA